MRYLSGIIFIFTSIFILSHFTQCANIVPPSGGPVDTVAPRIVRILPADSSLNVRPKSIEINFDKYMELGDWSTVLTISPLLDIQPQVTVNLRKVTITISDTLLLDNTTYTLYLGNTLKDNREGTVYSDFTYTFSTGGYIDSLSLKGAVLNAKRLNVDSQYIAALYPVQEFDDSTIIKSKPLYLTPVQKNGLFEFRHLPDKPFRMFVFHDKDNDRRYNPVLDGIAYVDSIFTPQMASDSIPVLYLFYKDLDSLEWTLYKDMSASLTSDEKVTMRSGRSSASSLIPKEGYTTLVDTTQPDKGTQELNKPLEIHFNHHLIKSFNRDKIYLSFDKDNTEIQAIIDIDIKDSVMYINTEWQENSDYILRLVKGWAVDSAEQDILPGKYIFRSKKNDDYSSLSIKFDSNYVDNDYWLVIYNESDSIITMPIKDSVLIFTQMMPSRTPFELYVFHDINKDGRWTPGDYMKKTQPEPVMQHHQGLVLRAGWTHEEVFKKREFSFISHKPKMKDSSDKELDMIRKDSDDEED